VIALPGNLRDRSFPNDATYFSFETAETKSNHLLPMTGATYSRIATSRVWATRESFRPEYATPERRRESLQLGRCRHRPCERAVPFHKLTLRNAARTGGIACVPARSSDPCAATKRLRQIDSHLRGEDEASLRSLIRICYGGASNRALDLFAARSGDALDNEIHDRLKIFRGKWIMSHPLLNDDSDPPVELLVAFLGHPRLSFEPRIEAAANVEQRHIALSQFAQLHQAFSGDQGIVSVDT
jgi:hypothetical protein